MKKIEAEVVIIGGGIVGALLALLLTRQNISVILVEKNRANLDLEQSQAELRVVALTQVSKNILTNSQVWDALRVERLSPFEKIMVWDNRGPAKIEFSSSNLGLSELGYIVENAHLVQAIYQNLAQQHNFILSAHAAENIKITDEKVEIISNDMLISGRLLVAADGGTSEIREQFAFATRTKPYQQTALVTNLEVEFPHANTARQCFLQTGPLAFLPLFRPNYCSIVWTNPPELTQQLLALPEQEFKQRLQLNFENKLGAITKIEQRLSFPLVMRHAEQYIKPRLALVGDAAHTAHPLAGQGVNLGILDVAILAEELTKAARKQRDLGAIATLQSYQARRHPHNQLMLNSFSGFNWLFGLNYSPVSWLRNLGMSVFNEVNLVKNLVTKLAIGYGVDLPEIGKFHYKH